MRKRVTKHEKDTLGIDSNNVNWPGHVCNVNGDDVMSKAEREKAIEVFENSIKCHEQQKKHICDHKCDRCGASRTYNIEEVEKAIDTAIKALSEESKLDKIIAEINSVRKAEGLNFGACAKCIDIINKYREVKK